MLKRRALEFKHTPTIGRTHGIHAEPTTFGLKLLNWYAEMERNLARFDAAAEDMRVGKLSGAVGTFGHLKPEHEERICARLGLKPAPVATQVIQRDRHAAYISTLAIIGSTLDKIAVEVRHLQRTEVREAQEYFSEKQKGSSAMPHKKNPITSEQISGLARVLRGNAQAAFEDIALWHERDISHSSVERVIFPDSTILVDYLLAKTTDLIDRLLVYPERMKKNLESTGGLIFSGQLLLDLAEAGMMREDAYRLVQSHAMRSWKENAFDDSKMPAGLRADLLYTRADAEVGQASLDELREIADNAAAMIVGELGSDPRKNGSDFYNRTAALIKRGWFWRYRVAGRLVFMCHVGSVSALTAQCKHDAHQRLFHFLVSSFRSLLRAFHFNRTKPEKRS